MRTSRSAWMVPPGMGLALLVLAGSAHANMALESYGVRHEATVDLTAYPGHVDWAFFTSYGPGWFWDDASGPWEPYRSGTLVPDTKAGVVLYAVRRDRLDQLRTHALSLQSATTPPHGEGVVALTPPQTLDASYWMPRACADLVAKGAAWIAMAPQPLGGRSSGNDGDDVRVTRTDHQLTDIRGNQIVLDGLAYRRFNASMTELSPQVIEETRERRTAAFLILGGMGLLGLGFVITRRARAQPNAG